MSAIRGIEIHNGYIVIPGGIKGIIGGTWSSPIAEGVAGKAGIQIIISSVAISGISAGGYFGVKANNASGTLEIAGARARATVLTGITPGGRVSGLWVEVEVLGNAVVSGKMVGVRVELYVESGATITGDTHGIFVDNYIDSQPTVYQMVRLEQNGSAIVKHMIAFYTGDAEYAFHFTPHTPTSLGWSLSDDKTGLTNAGWLRVDMQGTIKYVQLYGPT